MHLHEYQAKALLAQYSVPVPTGLVATSPEEALTQAGQLGGDTWMVKAQVHAGGRGKAGGVRKVHGREELETEVSRLLGSRLITRQTSAEGQPVNRVLLETPSDIQTELYLSLVLDREQRRVVIVASAAGGMDIEEVAARTPEKVVKTLIDPTAGLQGYQCRRVGFALGLNGEQRKALCVILQGLYRCYMERDLGLVELNPLAVTTDGRLLAVDAKINLDDNALYRQPDLRELHDTSQEDPKETHARAHDLNYIALDGDIACMVNGAGLAMATMDLIKLHGGEPANFLDVGGGTTAERVAEAFKLILSDDKVRAILVNIFGGIVRCDLIAEGIINAVREVGIRIPVVVRLEGTNVEQGLRLLDESGLELISAEDLTDAARKVVAAVDREHGT